MTRQVQVKIGEYIVVKSPDTLVTLGLGSCIGITFYERTRKIGGMAHIMLPDSKLFRKVDNVGKFADLALPAMLKEFSKLGIDKTQIVAKIAGGAQMFSNIHEQSIMDIGRRNIKAVKDQLKTLGIRLTTEDTGGKKGRSMIFDTETGDVTIRSLGNPLKII